MIFIAIILVLIALLLLVIGLRGRIVGRGVFCRGCGFDLEGIDHHKTDSLCPECGRSVADPGATRAIRRAKRKGMLVVGMILCVQGIGLAGVQLSGNSASLYAVMPDRVVLKASQWGDNDAIDELIVRLNPKSKPAEWVWEEAIDAALAYQADESQKWKPQWGEVFSLAMQGNRLSDAQIAKMIRNGIQIDVWLRDKIRPGDSYVGYLCEQRSKRLSALARYDTGFMLRVGMSSGGMIEDAVENPNVNNGGASSGTSFIFNTSGPTGMMATGSGVMLPKSLRSKLQVGDTFEVYMDVQITLRSTTVDREIKAEPFRFTQRVEVVGEDEQIVDVIQDPTAARQFIEGLQIEPIMAMSAEKVMRGMQREVANSSVVFSAKPRSVSGTLYLRHHTDGELFEASRIVTDARPVDPNQNPTAQFRHSYQISVQIDEDDLARREAFNRVVHDGVVDVVFLTDPSPAETNPKIDEVVDLQLVFVGVPVIVVGSQADQGIDPSKNMTPASELEDE